MKTLLNAGDLIDLTFDQNQIAIIDLSKRIPQYISYSELYLISNKIAHDLSIKLNNKSRVAILSTNCFEFLAIYLGILKANMTAVLIHKYFSNDYIEVILKDSLVEFVFTDNVDKFEILVADKTINIKTEFSQFIVTESIFELGLTEPNDCAVIFYSSGSTGLPKGIAQTHRSQLTSALRRSGNHKSRHLHKHLLCTPLHSMHGLGVAEAILINHATIVLMPDFNAADFANAIEQYKISILTVVPSVLSLLFSFLKTSRKYNFTSVVAVHLGSSTTNSELFIDIKNTFPNALNNIQSRYGLTELGGSLFGGHPDLIPIPEGSVGYPMPGVDCRIVNGILQAKSSSMLLEYVNRPDLQKKHITSDGFFITNDFFEINSNGFYFYKGRADDLLICGGENIYPIEIEQVLETHISIETAIVVPVLDKTKGEKPYAFVVLKHAHITTELDLQIFVLNKLRQNLLPRRIWRLQEVPLTANGKIDRSLLKELASSTLNVTNTKVCSLVRIINY